MQCWGRAQGGLPASHGRVLPGSLPCRPRCLFSGAHGGASLRLARLWALVPRLWGCLLRRWALCPAVGAGRVWSGTAGRPGLQPGPSPVSLCGPGLQAVVCTSVRWGGIFRSGEGTACSDPQQAHPEGELASELPRQSTCAPLLWQLVVRRGSRFFSDNVGFLETSRVAGWEVVCELCFPCD